jgi:outer membrane protein assembly factor BamD (BamD/ComL family)
MPAGEGTMKALTRTLSYRSWVHLLIACVCASMCGCAAHHVTPVTYERRLLTEAEQKFEQKQYEDALKIYHEIVTSPSYSQTPAARQALFRIGYLNIYCDNQKADPRAALEAFNSFRARYPDDKLIGEVNTYIKILMALRTFQEQYDETAAHMKRLQTKSAATSGSLDSLIESIQRCSMDRDSLDIERTALLKRITDLEQTIVKMEKTR